MRQRKLHHGKYIICALANTYPLVSVISNILRDTSRLHCGLYSRKMNVRVEKTSSRRTSCLAWWDVRMVNIASSAVPCSIEVIAFKSIVRPGSPSSRGICSPRLVRMEKPIFLESNSLPHAMRHFIRQKRPLRSVELR